MPLKLKAERRTESSLLGHGHKLGELIFAGPMFPRGN